jgi:hypothetical protein
LPVNHGLDGSDYGGRRSGACSCGGCIAGRLESRMIQADDDRLTSAVGEEIAHSEAHGAEQRQSAELALIIGEAVDNGRIIIGAARSASDEGCDRGRDADDGVNAALELLDIDAWIRGCDGHCLSLSLVLTGDLLDGDDDELRWF